MKTKYVFLIMNHNITLACSTLCSVLWLIMSSDTSQPKRPTLRKREGLSIQCVGSLFIHLASMHWALTMLSSASSTGDARVNKAKVPDLLELTFRWEDELN